ncbi:hypothetical protein C5167_004790 [Papaver somniferum]|uniref:Uncharacterized protein n=1 Tax=Papaver somniferum TaxID=3469 RepID=A0A4Y7JCF8_PAPSO|nr:hypothetical protein C5167_004790 [Papaver somniferum]
MEESVASTTRDFSELSVSINPPPSRRLEPIDFSRLRWGSIGFTLRRKDPNFDGCVDGNAARYEHVILFEGRLGSTFTVDDGPERDANDPINAEFLEDISSWTRYVVLSLKFSVRSFTQLLRGGERDFCFVQRLNTILKKKSNFLFLIGIFGEH